MVHSFIVPNLPWIIAAGMGLGFAGVAGWVFTTWLRIKHGYPLETSGGRPAGPRGRAGGQVRARRRAVRFAGVAGWVSTTWLRIKHGYPLETSWGRPLEPTISLEAKERL